jgi:3-phenylpropionate/trans-cinnamate dioxygenase ferredoxin subunit
MAEFVRVGSLAEVPDGELRAFELSGERACVAHVGGTVVAFGDECTHAGCSLAEDGEIVDADTVECVCHGSRFDMHSGEAVQGPAVDPLPSYAVQIVDGWIEVAPADEDGA